MSFLRQLLVYSLGLYCLVSIGLKTSVLANMVPFKQEVTCEHMQLSARKAVCEQQVCHLLDEVELLCEDIHLLADKADILLHEDQSFKALEAWGQVILVHDKLVSSCAEMEMDFAKRTTHLDKATINFMKTLEPKSAKGIPNGERLMIVYGEEIKRVEQYKISLKDGHFTLCDCGKEALTEQDKPPSWQLVAPKIDIFVNERINIWWPRLEINLFNLGWLVPISPPLAPLSLALKKRAMGFLPPQVQFMGNARVRLTTLNSLFPPPIIDLPFFLPLGDSWDVTFSPGVHTGWKTDKTLDIGALRVGLRLRYYPEVHTEGEFTLSLTHDASHMSAKLLQQKACLGNKDCDLAHIHYDVHDPRWDLTERLLLKWQHRTDFSPALSWVLKLNWVSDDLIRQDLSLNLQDIWISYQASRTQLLWRKPALVARLSLEYLQNLDTKIPFRDQNNNRAYTYVYKNYGSTTAHEWQRGPSLALTLLPISLFKAVHLDAGLSFVTLGPWFVEAKEAQQVFSSSLGLSWLENIGPLYTALRLGVEDIWFRKAASAEQASDLIGLGAFDLHTNLFSSYSLGEKVFWHVLSPRLTLKSLALRARETAMPYWVRSDLDEHFPRATFWQMDISLEQDLYRLLSTADAAHGYQAKEPILSLWLSQPFDLVTAKLLQTRLEMSAKILDIFKPKLWLSADLVNAQESHFNKIRELGGQLSLGVSKFNLSLQYNRFAPDAERFYRNMYQLVGAPQLATPVKSSEWIHSAQGSLGIMLTQIFQFTYSTTYLLPQPKALAPEDILREPGFIYHTGRLTYRSSCNSCWGMELYFYVPAKNTFDYRMGFMFNIGGYSIAPN